MVSDTGEGGGLLGSSSQSLLSGWWHGELRAYQVQNWEVGQHSCQFWQRPVFVSTIFFTPGNWEGGSKGISI